MKYARPKVRDVGYEEFNAIGVIETLAASIKPFQEAVPSSICQGAGFGSDGARSPRRRRQASEQ